MIKLLQMQLLRLQQFRMKGERYAKDYAKNQRDQPLRKPFSSE
jgi:hypothetical protein